MVASLQKEEILFSSFDRNYGQFPLYSSVDVSIATEICQQVVTSLLTAVDAVKVDITRIEGEAILPLPQFHGFSISYYFYLKGKELSEPSFSFLSLLLPNEQALVAYSNLWELSRIFKTAVENIKISFRPKRNLKESRVPSKVTTLLKKLHAPVRSILASKFRRPGQDFSPNTNFITGLAYSIIDKQGNVLIEISENFPIELVKRISMRFLASVVAKADRAMEYFGEAIIPVLETEDTVFCSFFRQAQNSDSIGILHVFARDKSALYRWAPILSDEARSISRMLAKEGPSVQARRVFFHLMTMFELAAGKHLTKSQDTTIFKNSH